MSAFRVGQRVRVILPAGRPLLGRKAPPHPALRLGCEATVVGTRAAPNYDFGPLGDVEITFPVSVDLPDGWDRVLVDLVDMACKHWQSQNPTMVMWPAGIGSKMLTNPYAMSDDEPMKFDDSIFAVDCSAREDYYGENPHNPDRERLRAEAAESKQRTAAKFKAANPFCHHPEKCARSGRCPRDPVCNN